MFELNLFHEQQQLQHDRDYDPVKLTILGGLLILSGLIAWYSVVYLSMAGLRRDIASKKAELKKLDNDLKAMGTLTDLGKIQSQAMSIDDRIRFRVLMATQIDILRDVIPTNCQVRSLKTVRTMAVTETVVKGAKKDFTVRKTGPSMDMLMEVETRGKTKVDVLQSRDSLLETLQREPRFAGWLKQVTNSNRNDVIILNGTTLDPKGGEPAIGIFEFKLPFALKDQPKEI
jgi:hypothetical protein